MYSNLKHADLTHQIINCSYRVHKALGSGFLEKVYHNALAIELKNSFLDVEIERPLSVKYRDQVVGEYYADLVVNNVVIVEIKATEKHSPAYEAQLLNYLKATGMEVGLLVNFSSSVTFKRMVF